MAQAVTNIYLDRRDTINIRLKNMQVLVPMPSNEIVQFSRRGNVPHQREDDIRWVGCKSLDESELREI